MVKVKYAFEEKVKGKWNQVGKSMGSLETRIAKGILKRASSISKKKYRIKKIKK